MNTIDEAIAFTESLLQKYKDELTTKKYETKLKRIKDKNADTNLYMSVIGEFSTGKSTFINALLRENLLESHILQGTTTINTVIEHGAKLNMIIHRQDAFETENLNVAGYSEETIRASIKSIHSGDTSQSISKVVIRHPSDFLEQGIVIIDTPGTNTPDLWHEKVTQNALRGLSDTSIILTAANQPVPDSLVGFIKENLNGVIDHCIFLVTKIDTIRQRERDEQIDYIKYTIQQKLGITDPIVLPYSPLLVLEDKTNAESTYPKNDRNDILNLSYETEELLYAYIKEHRSMIIKEKLAHLLNELLSEVNQDLTRRRQEYQQRSNVLKANTKKDLDKFSEEFCTDLFQSHINENQAVIGGYLNSLFEAFKKDIITIHDNLFNCTSQAQIKNYPQYVGQMLTFRKDDCSKVMHGIISDFVKNSNRMVEKFVMALNRDYSGLNALLPSNWKKEPKIDNISFDALPDITISLPALDSDAKIGGGVVAGAAIGTAIMPGIGTVIGGLVGGFFGSLLGPDLNTVKSQVWNESYPQITEQYDQLYDIVKNKIIECAEVVDSQALSVMDSHLDRYRNKIDYLISCDKKEKADIDHRVNMIGSDSDKISAFLTQFK